MCSVLVGCFVSTEFSAVIVFGLGYTTCIYDGFGLGYIGRHDTLVATLGNGYEDVGVVAVAT